VGATLSCATGEDRRAFRGRRFRRRHGRFLGAKPSGGARASSVIENRLGGGAVVGTDAVAKSVDGYTVLVMSNTHTVNGVDPENPMTCYATSRRSADHLWT
jgi:hypothetical protein